MTDKSKQEKTPWVVVLFFGVWIIFLLLRVFVVLLTGLSQLIKLGG